MAVFNTSSYGNLTQVTELLEVASVFSSGTFGLAILIMIFFATLFITSIFSPRDSFISASFIALISSLFLKYLGVLGDQFIIITIVLFIASLIFSTTGKGRVGGA